MLKKLPALVRSPKFFIVVLTVFIIQGIFFAVAINPSEVEIKPDGSQARTAGVVPDGNRHIGAIYYFAQQPIQNGPFVQDMADSDLWMGDLERFPSYLYYYIMGLIVRIPVALDAPDLVNVMIIRFVGLVFGVLALLVFRKIASEITKNRAVVNLSTLALVLTGSFVWLSPAENYDILALLIFFLFILSSFRLFMRSDPRQLYGMAVWLMLGSITKYTYLPFMALFGLVAVGLYVRKTGGVKQTVADAKVKIATMLKAMSKPLLVLLTTVLIIAGFLFAERIGGNLVVYQSVDPSCVAIHSHEACMNFGVYQRNFERQQMIAAGIEGAGYTFDPVYFTTLWIFKYYSSMYAYVAHIWIDTFSPIMFVGRDLVLIVLFTIAIYLLFRRIKVFDSVAAKYSLFVVGTLVLVQYGYNALDFIERGGVAYATQGRYLLPAIGFIYLLILLVVAKFLQSIPKNKRRRTQKILIVVAIIAILTNSALVAFFLHATTPEWFSWT